MISTDVSYMSDLNPSFMDNTLKNHRDQILQSRASLTLHEESSNSSNGLQTQTTVHQSEAFQLTEDPPDRSQTFDFGSHDQDSKYSTWHPETAYEFGQDTEINETTKNDILAFSNKSRRAQTALTTSQSTPILQKYARILT